jgi:hypothetical protein
VLDVRQTISRLIFFLVSMPALAEDYARFVDPMVGRSHSK